MTESPDGGVHVAEAGAGGDPVLLLHGIGGSAESFAAQIPALAGRYRVLAWDAPGYGRSADLAGPPGIEGYAEIAARVLRGRGAAPAHVVGVSWGGVIAARLAADHPGLVRSLVLASSSRGSGRDPGRAAAMRSRAEELARLGPAAFAARRAPRLVSPKAPAELVERVRTVMAAAIRLPGYAHAAASMAEADLTPVLGRVAAPALVIAGTEDEVTGPEESEAIASAIPGARLALVPAAGHAVNQERPGPFNSLLKEFLP
ncbi:alpha/beta fold hydrolase [Bailinhaonella thermotolerans]|uniref:Alpha/beta fold hydrolase n=1 Tax=Bailinhaonella thermotolerans TaxID=1070861 RepID=A0A3A4AYG7_9ACTN|nr:alpha/beta fold hydrolase [Bailinhaonella thermotolerans]RJL24422.1 alpha/beta fold hydrolase [Bailinhaonella thermotolerans]